MRFLEDLIVEPIPPTPRSVKPALRDSAGNCRTQGAIVREMLLTMDTLTIAGQRYIMRKIVEILSNRIDSMLSLRRQDRGTLSRMVNSLRVQCDHLLPDVRTFTARAEALLSVLDGPA